MKIMFKGIVKGAFSEYQASGIEEAPVIKFEGNSLHEVLHGLAIDEWTFILKVNGRRIKDVFSYIKRHGLNPEDYTRYQNGVMMV